MSTDVSGTAAFYIIGVSLTFLATLIYFAWALWVTLFWKRSKR